MNKITKILLATSLCLILLIACAPQAVNTPLTATPTIPTTIPTEIPTTTPTEIPADTPFKEDDFVVPVRLDFESQEDFKYFNYAGSINKDETASFAQFLVPSTNLQSLVNYDTALHIRWQINAENTCERFALAPFVSQNEEVVNAYMVGVGGCSFLALQTELASLGSDNPVAYDSPFRSQGTLIMEDGQWLDVVFWIEKGTPTPSLKLFAWQTENPNIYYAEKRLLNGLEEANMFSFSFDIFFGSIAVDSFQMISGNLESYLWFNAPAFSKNYEDVVTLFNTDLSDK